MPDAIFNLSNFHADSMTGVNSGASVSPDHRASHDRVAQEIESTFLSLVLKELRQTEEPDGLFAGDSGDVLGGLFDQLMGQHLSAAGGIGLAADLTKYLSPHVTPTRNATGTESLREPAGDGRASRGSVAGVPAR